MAVEPAPRHQHFATAVGERQLCLYGGNLGPGRHEPPATLHVFSSDSEMWREASSKGTHPLPDIRDGAFTSNNHLAFLHGGNNGKQYSNCLYQLDCGDLTWTQLSSAGDHGAPMPKCGHEMVYHAPSDNLLIFGGRGPPPTSPTQPGALYESGGDCVFTNELHLFNLKDGKWSTPAVSGAEPPPCAGFTLTMVDDHRAVLFGGCGGDGVPLKHMYVLDIARMHWSEVDADQRGPWPVERFGHVAVCLGFGGGHPFLLITGGMRTNALSDAWTLDLKSWKWRKVKGLNVKPRWGHSAIAFNISQEVNEVVMFGGVDDSGAELAYSTVVRFEWVEQPVGDDYPTREWVPTDVAAGSELGVQLRIRQNKELLIAEDSNFIYGAESLSRRELEFCANIEKHMRSSGVIDRFLAHLVFVGFPASGKTTLIYRLLNLAISIEASSSTGVMDGIITVNIGEDKASMHAANVDEIMEKCLWHKAEFSLSCLRQMGMLPGDQPSEFNDHDTTTSHEETKFAEGAFNPADGSHAVPDPAIAVANQPVPYTIMSDHTYENSALQAKVDAMEAPIQSAPAKKGKNITVLLAAMERTLQEKGYSAEGFSAILPFLKNKTTLYLSDTGGQIEFQELLPLLVTGYAIFLFLFPLNKDLDKPICVSYHKKGGGEMNAYTSSLTIEETFLQTLSSIDSMRSSSNTSVITELQHKPAVFVIGTHKDCLIKELGEVTAESKIFEIDSRIKNLVTQHGYGDLVKYADRGRGEILFAVDNTRESEVFSKIRSRIMSLIHEEDKFHIEFPLSYLLASLHLDSVNEPFVKRSDFAEWVEQYGIKGEDVDHLLHFLHNRIGQILYFPLKEIRDVIVRKPQALYDIVTDLIMESYLLPSDVAQATEVKRGIYSLDFFKKYSYILNPVKIIALLKELRIIAPFFDKKAQETKIFIPCVLNHLEDPPEENASNIHPLAIIFNSGHCPQGMFGVLIHYLLNSRSRLVWNLNMKKIFRNQVSFEVGGYQDEVIVKFHTAYIEVRYHPKEHPQRNPEFTEKKICNMIRSVLISGIEQSIVSLRYSPDKTKHRFGLVCRKCCSAHEVTEGGHSMQCPKQSNAVVPNSGSYWFENSSESVDCEAEPIEGQHTPSGTESLSRSGDSYTESLSMRQLEFCANIEEHLKSSGTIDRFLAHLVFVGLPASGKTTLIARLLNLKVIIEASRSTGVMKGIITVSIGDDKATMHAVNVDDQTSTKWHEVDFDLSCLRQMGMLSENQPSKDKHHGMTTSRKEIAAKVAENDSTPANHSHVAPDHTAVADQPSVVSDPHTYDDSTLQAKLEIPIYSVPAEEGEDFLSHIESLLQEKGYSAEGFNKIRPFLNNKTTLYLSDTGGQIEFQELLPLLVAGYAIFLFLFPLNIDLDKPVPVSYRKEGGGEMNAYTSSLTIEDSFLQTLSSIDSMHISSDPTAAKDNPSSELQHKPAVFVIGTHKDCLIEKLGEAAAEEKIAEIDYRIKELVTKHGYGDLVMYTDRARGEMLFAVDNTRENNVFQIIRSRIMALIREEKKFHIKFPLSYLLASMHLGSKKEPFIKKCDFIEDVKRYLIKEEDVDHLLCFLHTRIGQIRYFPQKEIKDDIVKEPQKFYDIVTHLITESFLLPNNVAQDLEVKRGIYSWDSFKGYSDILKPDKIIALLKELRIVAPFMDPKTKEKKFFIPCVLNHLKDPPEEDTCKSSSIQPLAVMFDRGHCPKGMFGVLIHYLLTQGKSSSQLDWSLNIEKIFRNQVSFQVGDNQSVVTIKFHSAYIEVRYCPTEFHEHCKPDFTEKKICNTIRSVLVSGIKESIASLRYSPEKTKYTLGLVCWKCCSAHAVTKGMRLKQCSKQETSVVPNPGSYWFKMPTFIFKDDVTLKERCTPHRKQFSVSPCVDESSLKLSKDPPIDSQDHVTLGSGLKIICFKNLEAGDEGMYKISGRNEHGCAEFSFHLSVKRRSKYIFSQRYLESVASSSSILKFSVDPPVPEDTEHILSKKDGEPAPARFEVKDDHIIFRKLKEEDSGEYIISCHDTEGELVKETLELEVVPFQPSPPTHGTTPYPGYQQPPYQHGNNAPPQSQGYQPSHGQQFQYQQQQQQQQYQQQQQPSPYEHPAPPNYRPPQPPGWYQQSSHGQQPQYQQPYPTQPYGSPQQCGPPPQHQGGYSQGPPHSGSYPQAQNYGANVPYGSCQAPYSGAAAGPGQASVPNSYPSPVDAQSRGVQPQREQQQPAGEIVVRSEDVNFLMNHLHNYAYKWKDIGSSLNFHPGKIKNISSSNPSADTPQLLTTLLCEWCQWPTLDHPHDHPTMEKLCDALKTGLVNLGAVANNLYAQRDSLPSRQRS